MTPVANNNGQWLAWEDALFTATSSTCVTGLVIADTGTQFSLYGQIVIITLIQIGGLGFITFMTLFSIFIKRKISLSERKLIMQSTGTLQIGGTVKLVRRIALGTLLFEGCGALILAIRFSFDYPWGKAIYYGIFHSVSAFCNAGFDVFGKGTSLAPYTTDPTVMLTICALIFIGGLGFLVWSDMVETNFCATHFRLHTKLALFTSVFLVVGGTVFFLLTESRHAFSHLHFGEKVIASLFQAITPRTAGFAAIDLNTLKESSYLVTIIFMFIGGSPGSTAGGIKTVTLAVLFLGAVAKIKQTEYPVVFKKRLGSEIVEQASAVDVLYLMAVITATVVISQVEPFSLQQILFEVTSAIGTVGLTLGITPQLTVYSKLILCLLMYMGRVGGLSFALALRERKSSGAATADRPAEKVIIG